mgnify:CR=1 FL=1
MHDSLTSTFFERVHIGRQADPRLGGRGFGVHASKSLLRTLSYVRHIHACMGTASAVVAVRGIARRPQNEAHRDTNYCN